MTAPKKAHPDSQPQAPADPHAEVEAMIVRLTELRQREAGKERRADYGAAIDRLHALAYRLEIDAAPGRTIGMPKAPAPAPIAPAPSAAAKPPQAALPLGPVIVRARKPRPR